MVRLVGHLGEIQGGVGGHPIGHGLAGGRRQEHITVHIAGGGEIRGGVHHVVEPEIDIRVGHSGRLLEVLDVARDRDIGHLGRVHILGQPGDAVHVIARSEAGVVAVVLDPFLVDEDELFEAGASVVIVSVTAAATAAAATTACGEHHEDRGQM